MRCANRRRPSTRPAPRPSGGKWATNYSGRSCATWCPCGPTARSRAPSNAVPKPINSSIGRGTNSGKFPIGAAMATKTRRKIMALSKRHSELTPISRLSSCANGMSPPRRLVTNTLSRLDLTPCSSEPPSDSKTVRGLPQRSVNRTEGYRRCGKGKIVANTGRKSLQFVGPIA